MTGPMTTSICASLSLETWIEFITITIFFIVLILLVYDVSCVYSTRRYLSAQTDENSSDKTLEDNLKDSSTSRKIILPEEHVRKNNFLAELEARAHANQRLVQVFGIDNSFTTTKKARYDAFNALSRTGIKHADWNDLARKADTIMKLNVDKADDVYVMPLVQSLTLRLALQVFFDKVDATNLDGRSIDIAASEINTLWVQSKNPACQVVFQDQSVLHRALRILLPHEHLLPKDNNPLNLILPSYETIWRVALLAFLETCRPSVAKSYELLHLQEGEMDMFSAFLRNPGVKKSEASAQKIFDFTKEALRLYPSTKRIYRDYLEDDEISKCVIDVEARHLDQDTWCRHGDDAAEMKAFRSHENVPSNMYMPFGQRPLECPAKSDFGERMIALIVATLHAGLRGWELDGKGTREILTSCKSLKSGRDDLGDWRMVRSNLLAAFESGVEDVGAALEDTEVSDMDKEQSAEDLVDINITQK